MVVSLSDIKHLELMDGLAERQAAPKSAETIEKASGLTPKLLRLANSLRANGFEDYALNIEDKMMRIKRAQTIDIYKAHKETGEDLVNEAHPDGDWSVGSGEGDLGDVETIVSNFKKMRKIVEKMPTGKLAAVVEMCKVVLGDGAPNSKPSGDTSKPNDEAAEKLSRTADKAKSDFALKRAGDLETFVNGVGHLLASWPSFAANMALLKMHLTTATKNPDVDALDDAAESLNNLMQALDPKTDWKSVLLALTPVGAMASLNLLREWFGGISEANKQNVIDLAKAIGGGITQARLAAIDYNTLTRQTYQPSTVSPDAAAITQRQQEISTTDLYNYQDKLLKELISLKTQWTEKGYAKTRPKDATWFGQEQIDIKATKTIVDLKKENENLARFAHDLDLNYQIVDL